MTHTERENNLLKQDLNERGYSEVIVSKSSHFVIIRKSSHFVINKEFTKCQLFSVTNVSKIS